MFLFLESQLSYLEQKHLLAIILLNIEFFKRLCNHRENCEKYCEIRIIFDHLLNRIIRNLKEDYNHAKM